MNYTYQNQIIWQFSWKFVQKNVDPFFTAFLTSQGKNENEDEKIRENDLRLKKYDFWILHIKILGCVAVSLKIWKKKFDPVFRTVWISQGKNKDEDEKLGKRSLIFELYISKSDYMAVFLKICWKKFWPTF